ncbi:cellulase family glycosylhydrolase [Fibrobacter sp.]|uniref:cellulase family glycosylhydrolase n=1 Tax=Fibrobacter sp. TaxID=35828 RepID=UPI0038905F40
MLQLRFPKLLALSALALGLFSATFASDITPLRTGPVSQYGQLQAGTNNAGEGRIYGSCEHFSSSGNEVQVKGMSLFWSCAANQQRYWKKDIITGLVERQNIQLIRAAMAVDDMGDWADGHYFTKPEFYQAMLDEAVEAAIENDIYVIIDFHSHVAADSVKNAKDFFAIQAQKWGDYDNVIFEVFNEPICASGSVGDNSDCSEYGGYIGMAAIKTYADQVVSVIREYSDNLIIVGTPMWDQQPNQAINYRVEDPLENDNIAYAFHYYAGRSDGDKAHGFSLSSNADLAMKKGLSVFVSEWGTVGYDGGGAPSATLNPQWQTWMDSRKISSANWNVGKSGDPSSESGSEYFGFNFDPDNAPDNWTYSLSGQWVNDKVFAGLPTSYVACSDYVPASSSSSDVSSSSDARSYAVEPYYTYVYAGDGWTIANEEGEFGLVAEVIDEETGKPVIGLKGVVAENENGWAGIGMNVGDLDGCQLLQYDYKGLPHNLALANTNTPDGADVVVKYDISATDTWETFTLDMSALSGIDLQSGLDIKWQLAAMGNGNLYVDNVRCVVPASSSSSSGDEPASSSSIKLPVVAAPTANTELFDDFEDGDYYPLWDGIGQWWAETDVVGGGGSSNAELSFVKGSASAKALQMSYSLDVGDYPWGPPYATISTNDFNEMNLSQCSEVRYDYKGAAHKFRLKVSSTVNGLLDMGWGFPTFAVTSPSDSWQTVTIPVASLRQEWTGLSGNWVDVETVLQYANGFDWRVDGEDTDDKSSGILAIDNIRCVGLAETQYYTVTFKNGDGSTMETQTWAENSNLYDPGLAPTKESTAQYEFLFTGWSPSLMDDYEPVRVTDDAIYTPVFTENLRYYEITFLTDDDDLIKSDFYAYGTEVAGFSPSAPAKAADDSCTYAFAGWDPAFDSETIVEGEVTYKATYEPTMKSFDITFKNKDGGVIEVVSEVYGTLADEINAPTAPGVQGRKFAGWTPGLTRVTGEAVYTATYTDKFVITWKDYNGNVLWTDFLDEGETPDYGAAPARAATAEYTYTFKGWSPAVAEVTDDAIYTATYDSTKNKYDVVFYDEDGTTSLVALTAGPYEYGTLVSSIAPTPTKAATAQYSYTFAGWNPAVTNATAVTDDVSYTAVYTETVNTYTITFVLDDGTTEYATVTRDYGTEISTMLPKVDPVKAADAQYTYEFVKWVAEDGSDVDMDAWLGSDMTLKAKFSQFVRKYTVTFLNYNSDVLKAATLYEYGADVVIPDDPTRDPAGVYTYEFSGWSPLVTQVTQEQVYTATYDSTAHYGAIAISVIDGKKTATIDGSYTDGDVVNIPASIDVDTVVFNRTFSASGYSTITLPFSINRNAIEGVSKVLTFTGIGYDENGKKQVEMEEVNGELSAYKPYMVELSSEGSLVFHGNSMVIQPTEGANTVVQGDDGWEFRGTLSKIVWDEKHSDLGRVYGFSAKEANNVRIGQFVKAGKGAWINPFRAYMIYNEGNSAGKSAGHAYVSAEPLPDYMDVVVVSRGATGEESKTVIGGINTRTGEFKMMQDYDLKGRKLNGKPTARGVYYGKKKIVK